MKRISTLLALAALGAHAASTLDTGWQYTPYSSEATDIKVFRSGTNPLIWVGTQHGVVRIKGTDTLWLHPTNSNLVNEVISPANAANQSYLLTYTALDSSGSYWIARANANSLTRIDTNGNVTVLDSTGATPWSNLSGITASKSAVYVGLANGTIYYNAAPTGSILTWSVLTTGDGLATISLSTLAYGWGDTLWVGYDGNANGNLKYIALGSGSHAPLFFVDSSSATIPGGVYGIWFSNKSLQTKFIRTTAIGTYGNFDPDTLTAITSTGATQKFSTGRKGEFLAIPSPGNYPYFAKKDTIWQPASTQGLFDLVELGSPVSGLSAAVATSATPLAFLLGTTSGFYSYDGSKANPASYGTGKLVGTGVVGATHGASGALWIATDSAVYSRTDAKTSLTKVYAPAAGKIRTISLDSNGVVWVGQSNGLYKLNGTTASYVSALGTDSVLSIANAASHQWFLSRTSAGVTSLYEYTGTWTKVPLTGIGADSSKITKLRAPDDGSLWALAGGSVVTYTGIKWKHWNTATISGNGPGSGDIYSFDLAQNNLWFSFQGSGQYQAYSWAGEATSDTINVLVSGTTDDLYYPCAESDTSAWYFASSSAAKYTGVATSSDLFHASKASGANVRITSTVDGGQLHKGVLGGGENIFTDNAGGLWIVMKDGVSRLKVSTSTTSISGHAASAVGSASASIRDGKLVVSIAQATSVRVQTLDMNGRVLDDRDLGALTAGSHTVGSVQGHGVFLVRVWTNGLSQTIHLPAL